MRKVLLVDDALNIRKGIRALIERMETGFTQIDDCENGQLALEMINKIHYDLVITDIKMPVLDGIGLIEQVQKLDSPPMFIVLSGYDDFSYAKSTMRFGVKSYLLKPVNRFELAEALEKALTEIKSKENNSHHNIQLGSLINNILIHEMNSLLTHENLAGQEISNLLHTLHPDFFHGSFAFSILSAITVSGEDLDPFRLNDKWRDQVISYFDTKSVPVLCFTGCQGNLLLVLGGPSGVEILPDFSQLLSCLENQADCNWAVYAGETGTGSDEIKKSYLHTLEAFKYRMVSTERIIYYSDIRQWKKIMKLPVEKIEKIPSLIGAGRINEATEIINGIFSPDNFTGTDIGYLEKLTDYFYSRVIQYYSNNLPMGVSEMENYIHRLKNIYTYHKLIDYKNDILSFISEVGHFLEAMQKNSKGRKEIEVALAYIHKNYARDLNMAMVANYVSINYTYFSCLFSEYTGMNFSDYFKKIRVENSKELLKNTNEPVNVISEKVGFKNARHFARVFRELTGVNPLEFRNRLF